MCVEFCGGYKVYSESGIDLTLLRERLKMTVTEMPPSWDKAMIWTYPLIDRRTPSANSRNNSPAATVSSLTNSIVPRYPLLRTSPKATAGSRNPTAGIFSASLVDRYKNAYRLSSDNAAL